MIFVLSREKSGFRIRIGGGNAPLLSPIRKIEKKAQQKDVISSNPEEIKKMINFSVIACVVVIILSFFAIYQISVF